MRKCEGDGWRRGIPSVAMPGLLLLGLAWSTTHSYVLFHTLADIERTRAAGFAEHLVKPISSIDALTSALARCRPSDR